MIWRRHRSSTWLSRRRAAVRCPAGAAGAVGSCPEPVADQMKGRGDDQIAAHGDVHSRKAGCAGGLGDLIGRHGRARAQAENPHLGNACQRFQGTERQPLGCDVGGMLSTPPGLSARKDSSKNARRDRKWKAASTLITPSMLWSAIGSRVASPATPSAAASRSRSRAG